MSTFRIGERVKHAHGYTVRIVDAIPENPGEERKYIVSGIDSPTDQMEVFASELSPFINNNLPSTGGRRRQGKSQKRRRRRHRSTRK